VKLAQTKIIIQRGEDFGFIAHAPALRGCWSQGPTRRKALANIREAIHAWLEVKRNKSATHSKAAASSHLIRHGRQ
jgi:predicted RNase H-like HicB family nuclease